MKQLAVLFFFGFVGMIPKGLAQTKIPTIELHISGNHTLEKAKEDRTFYGGGFGANVVFRDAGAVSFKTGLEANFFHTWNPSRYTGKMSSSTNVHYNYWNLNIPAMLRLNVGNKVRFFMEAGGYLGIPLGGIVTSKFHSYPMYQGGISVSEIRQEQYDGFVSISAAAALGGIFPVSTRMDLILKPEFVFRRSLRPQSSPIADFNERFSYFRLCLGIRINLNQEIE